MGKPLSNLARAIKTTLVKNEDIGTMSMEDIAKTVLPKPTIAGVLEALNILEENEHIEFDIYNDDEIVFTVTKPKEEIKQPDTKFHDKGYIKVSFERTEKNHSVVVNQKTEISAVSPEELMSTCISLLKRIAENTDVEFEEVKAKFILMLDSK